jgi:FkbM family methyltransferase
VLLAAIRTLLRRSVNLLPLAVRERVKDVPLLAGLQRRLTNRLLSGEPFLHTINAGPARGLRFEITLPADKAIWLGTFEAAASAALLDGVAAGDVCFDVGGYRGYTAGVLALGGARQVVVFEPLPRNVAALRRLIELNPRLPVTVEPVAVGAVDGAARFKIMPDASMGKLASSGFQPSAAPTEEIVVPMVRLDSLVLGRGLPWPDVLKIDVEGAELEVLDGAAQLLARKPPKIFLEAHSARLAEQCAERLGRCGYRIRQLEAGALADEQTRHLIARPR